jgi:hypothetical protein
MDNPEKLATLSIQDTGQINVRENRRDNPEKLATLSIQDTGQINVKTMFGSSLPSVVCRKAHVLWPFCICLRVMLLLIV